MSSIKLSFIVSVTEEWFHAPFHPISEVMFYNNSLSFMYVWFYQLMPYIHTEELIILSTGHAHFYLIFSVQVSPAGSLRELGY